MRSSLKAYANVCNSGALGADFPKDAIHGARRKEPDCHMFYQWLMHNESGVKYSHYDLLVKAEPAVPVDRIIALPQEVQLSEFHARKNQMARFFDPKTYFGRNFEFPKMEGKITPKVDEDSFMQPAKASKMQNFFEHRTYEGKTYQFPVMKGKLPGTSDLTKESFEKFFNISPNTQPQPKAREISSAAKQMQLEYESQPQSLEGALVLHDVPASTNPVETQAQTKLADEKPKDYSGDDEHSCVTHTSGAALENESQIDPFEERLFKLFQPILDGEVQPNDSQDSDVDSTEFQESAAHVDSEQSVRTGDNLPQVQAQPQEPQSTCQVDSENIAHTGDNLSQCQVQTQPLVCADEPQQSHTHDKDDRCFAMRLPESMLDEMCKSNNVCIIVKWKLKQQSDTKVCFVSSEGRTTVVATALLSGIDTISSVADLRVHAAARGASTSQKEQWRSYLLQKKSLYVWNFFDLVKISTPLELPPFRGRSMWINLNKLKPHVEKPIPGMDLHETCEFFINRLNEYDYEKLGKRFRLLGGHTISIGSTCSGTDICVGMMKATVEKLNEKFNASRYDSEMCLFLQYLNIYK